jgi:hypothetical protein
LATAATVAPGSSASDMIRSFSSAGQCRRRSTVDMISAAMCLTVLSHVLKDSMLHRSPAAQQAATPAALSGRLQGEGHGGVFDRLGTVKSTSVALTKVDLVDRR